MRDRFSTAQRSRRAAGWVAALALVGLACGGDPVGERHTQPSPARDGAAAAGHSAGPTDAGPTRSTPGIDARVVLPIDEDPKPVGDAAASPGAPAASDGGVGPAASDGAISEAGVPNNGCDAKAGACGPSAPVSCDATTVKCKRAPPVCPEGQVPAVVDTCWGECVGIEECSCTVQDDCPDRGKYACHMSARHCGPYVN